ncbi:hypothetical protein [Planotetraspora phitsanulokensis]|nr:hypothetical protein [Planotetraspora phitsanulokensis]
MKSIRGVLTTTGAALVMVSGVAWEAAGAAPTAAATTPKPPAVAASSALGGTSSGSGGGAGGSVYVRFNATGAAQIVWARPGAPLRVATLGGGRRITQVAVSPDGTKAAWVYQGKVHVTRYTATGRAIGDRTIATDAGHAPCETPVFSPDSKTVAYPSRAKSTVPVIAAAKADGTKRYVIGRIRGSCHLAWSGNGRYLAGYSGGTAGVHLLDVRTHTSRKVPGIRYANHVQSLSPNGRRMIVHRLTPSDPGGDGMWPYGFRPTIVDTKTGKTVAIPVRGTLLGAMYLKDGRLMVRVKGKMHNTLVVVTASGKIQRRTAEPAKVRRDALVAFPK